MGPRYHLDLQVNGKAHAPLRQAVRLSPQHHSTQIGEDPTAQREGGPLTSPGMYVLSEV